MSDHRRTPPVCAEQTLVQMQPNPDRAAYVAGPLGNACANSTTGAQPVSPTSKHSKASTQEFAAGKSGQERNLVQASKLEEVLAANKEDLEEEEKKFLEGLPPGEKDNEAFRNCLLYTSPSPRDS